MPNPELMTCDKWLTDTDVTVTDIGSGVVITTIDGDQVYSIQANRADYDDIPLFGITQINMNDTGSNLISQLTANTASLDLNFVDNLSTFDVSFAGVDIIRVNKDNLQILSGLPDNRTAKSCMRATASCRKPKLI